MMRAAFTVVSASSGLVPCAALSASREYRGRTVTMVFDGASGAEYCTY